ncbi:TPA: hypothetical protein N0F65_012933 [Lagenidium giganteum]|uniref:Uncharacterized protein n=1 Tax=Lagenidium giganteum TaxID=4803 RepID=A0AAV2Z4P3_9STRA|nr:TPA: hypothetical protein N0F65_012933 [Lagenidium giganteum]
MVQFKRFLVPHAFLASLEFDPEHQATHASVTAALDTTPENPPIQFDRITARDFMTPSLGERELGVTPSSW